MSAPGKQVSYAGMAGMACGPDSASDREGYIRVSLVDHGHDYGMVDVSWEIADAPRGIDPSSKNRLDNQPALAIAKKVMAYAITNYLTGSQQ